MSLTIRLVFFAGLADRQKKKGVVGWVWNCTDAGDGGDADQAPPSQLKHTLLLQQSAMETQGILRARRNQLSCLDFFRFERRFSLPRSSWPTQQPFTSSSARQAFHFDSFPWWDISIVRWNWPIPNLGRLWHIQPVVHPSDSVWEEKDDGLHGQIRHQPQEHPQLTAQELYKGENQRKQISDCLTSK